MFYTIAKWQEDKAKREKNVRAFYEKQFLDQLRDWVKEGRTVEDFVAEHSATANGSSSKETGYRLSAISKRNRSCPDLVR